MIDEIKNSLLDCPMDNSIYLIKKLSCKSGFFMTNRHLLYMVSNFETVPFQTLTTEYLKLNTDVEIVSIKNNQEFPSGRYNVLEFVAPEERCDEFTLDSFVKLCAAHTEYMQAKNFVKFFYSLINLCQYPHEQQYKNLIGFFGELYFIKLFLEITELDLSSYWHVNGSKDKYEITFSGKNLEIKTTASREGNVTIKHSQLFNEDDNYLVVISIEENSSGKTLNELIQEMQTDNNFNNYNFYLNIEKEKKRVSYIDADTKKFNVIATRMYNAHAINPFLEIPDSVSELVYKMDLLDKGEIAQDRWFYEISTE